MAVVLLSVCLGIPLAQEDTVIPRPTDPPFNGKIGLTSKDSTPSFPAIKLPPKGAPNVFLVLLDDVGFGNPSTFGGPIQTPTLDRLARSGIRYNSFPAPPCSRGVIITMREPLWLWRQSAATRATMK